MNGNDQDEFQDPLENYEPRKYSDPLEQALVEEEVDSIRHQPFVTIPPSTPIHEAVETLCDLHVACLMIAKNDQLLGVFSNRDVLTKVAIEFDEIKDQPVETVMTTDPIFVNESDSAVTALSVMAQCGYRHVPVVDLGDHLTGIISPQRVSEFLQRHFIKE